MSAKTPLMFFMGFVVIVFGLAPTTTAELCTVQFQGVVDRISGDGFLDGSVAVGDEFTGSYTFDTAKPSDHTYKGEVTYRFTSPDQRFILAVGNYAWRSTDMWDCGVINNATGLYNNVRDMFEEGSDYIVVEQTAGGPVPAYPPDNTFILQFGLGSTTNLSVITNTVVPRTLPDVGLCEINYLSIAGTGWEIHGRFTVPVVNTSMTLPYEGSVSESGEAFRVNNTYSGAGKSYGGWFQAAGDEGRGVYGRSTGTTPDVSSYGGFFYAAGPQGRGAFGQSAGAKGIGVKGWASNSGNVENYGGHFCATGLQGIGVYGWAENQGDAENYGGSFVAEGDRGIGLYAIGGPSSYAGRFEGDIKISGAGSAIVFPDGTRQYTATGSGSTGGGVVAAACATPDYDSGWIGMPIFPPGTSSKTLTHNLGGNLDKYVVDLQYRVSGWGSSVGTNTDLGAKFYYSNLTTSSITISGPQSALDAYVGIRARIWVYK